MAWRIILVLTVAAAAATAQDAPPKSEPSAMGSDYNPLMWRGDDAQFAINTEHTSYCQAEFSKQVASKVVDSNVLAVARLSAAEHEKLYRKLKLIGRSLNFEFPPKAYIQSCPEFEKSRSLEGPELQKAYLNYLRQTTDASIQQFDAEIAQRERPYNYSLRKLAQKELPVLREIQDKLSQP